MVKSKQIKPQFLIFNTSDKNVLLSYYLLCFQLDIIQKEYNIKIVIYLLAHLIKMSNWFSQIKAIRDKNNGNGNAL
jgi:hypothetical protein